MADVTQILSAIEHGDPHAAEQLLTLVYNELRRLAAQKLSRETPGQTLDATGLVHEAYLRLFGAQADGQQHWDSRGHFFAAAAEAMRRILIENARRKKRVKHGGDRQRVTLLDEDLAIHDSPDENPYSVITQRASGSWGGASGDPPRDKGRAEGSRQSYPGCPWARLVLIPDALH